MSIFGPRARFALLAFHLLMAAHALSFYPLRPINAAAFLFNATVAMWHVTTSLRRFNT